MNEKIYVIEIIRRHKKKDKINIILLMPKRKLL